MGKDVTAMEKSKDNPNVSVLTAYNQIPYALIGKEIEGSCTHITKEFGKILEYYKVYKKGINFQAEGTGGHYVAAQLRYKKVATLINKEARFLFGQVPDITVESDGDAGAITEESKTMITTMQSLVDKILRENKFESVLLKASKDCFIGKRIAVMVNFNEEDGVTVKFIPSINFIYETKIDNSEVLTKFVSFTVVRNNSKLSEKRIFKKKFELVQDVREDGTTGAVCYLEEGLYDGRGVEIEMLVERQPTLLDKIPVAIIINDGLTNETEGESEVELLSDYEQWYSKLSSADIDAERKSMNPIRYTVDMTPESTKGLSSSAGSYWDLTSDQNEENARPDVGVIECNMSYSESLDATLKRIRASMYEEIDMPDVTLENIQGVITSGKAMKCMYWPLIVRCQEKMKSWAPALEYMTRIIIEGSMLYPNTIVKYTDEAISPVGYEVNVVQNFPLPEDEQEEKTIDLSEVNSSTMSRKTYMQKWRQLTDDEVDNELEQIAKEMSIIDGVNMEGMKFAKKDETKINETDKLLNNGPELEDKPMNDF